MVVMKFGGAALSRAEGFEQMEKILRAETKRPLLMVISALSKTTSQLENAAKTAEMGFEHDAIKQINIVVSNHRRLSQKLIHGESADKFIHSVLESGAEHLKKLIRGVAITRELTARTLDIILSYGELFALKIIASYLLEKNIPIAEIDASEIIVTNDRFGNAQPNFDLTKKNVIKTILPSFDKGKIALIQGFVASAEDGQITTMGIESSNLTTALLADILGAKEIVYWTDVEGIRTADPKLIYNSKQIARMDYRFALSSAVKGLKLIFPGMIEIAKKGNIKLLYRSVFDLESKATEISFDESGKIPLMIFHDDIIKLTFDLLNSEVSKKLQEQLFCEINRLNSVLHISIANDKATIYLKEARTFKKSVLKDINHIKDDSFACLHVSGLSERQIFESLETADCSGKAEIWLDKEWASIFLPKSISKQAADEIHKRLAVSI